MLMGLMSTLPGPLTLTNRLEKTDYKPSRGCQAFVVGKKTNHGWNCYVHTIDIKGVVYGAKEW